MTDRGGAPFLVVRLGAEFAAIPVRDVIETLRPLPVEPVTFGPEFVLGVAVIRGVPTPVVDVGRLLAGVSRPATRFVVVRAGSRCVALAMDGVAGVRRLTDSELTPLPPLLAAGARRAVEALGTLDSELLVVLEAARLLPEAQPEASTEAT